MKDDITKKYIKDDFMRDLEINLLQRTQRKENFDFQSEYGRIVAKPAEEPARARFLFQWHAFSSLTLGCCMAPNLSNPRKANLGAASKDIYHPKNGFFMNLQPWKTIQLEKRMMTTLYAILNRILLRT